MPLWQGELMYTRVLTIPDLENVGVVPEGLNWSRDLTPIVIQPFYRRILKDHPELEALYKVTGMWQKEIGVEQITAMIPIHLIEEEELSQFNLSDDQRELCESPFFYKPGEWSNLFEHHIGAAIAVRPLIIALMKTSVPANATFGHWEVMARFYAEKTYLGELFCNANQLEPVLSEKEAYKIEKMLLMHDIAKAVEVFVTKILGLGYSEQSQKLINKLIVYILKNAKEEINEEDVFSAIEAGKYTGHHSLKSLITVSDGNVVLSTNDWVRLLVHLADDMLTSWNGYTYVTTPALRMEQSSFREKYQDPMFTRGLGYDPIAKMFVHIDDIQSTRENTTNLMFVKTYYEWQIIVSEMICNKLVSILNPGALKLASVWVAEFVNQSYNTGLFVRQVPHM